MVQGKDENPENMTMNLGKGLGKGGMNIIKLQIKCQLGSIERDILFPGC